MVKNKINPIILIVIAGLAIWAITSGNFFEGAITGNEVMSRTGSSAVDVGDSFQITYSVSGGTGSWGASIEDTVSGGCTFPSGGTTYRSVMISDDGNTKSITINAPNNAATCTFSGNYKFGTLSTQNLNSYSVQVRACTPSCSRPSNLCTQASTVSDGCGGTCSGQWTVTQNSQADTNCNNEVDRTELGSAISLWVNNNFDRTELGRAISVWAGG